MSLILFLQKNNCLVATQDLKSLIEKSNCALKTDGCLIEQECGLQENVIGVSADDLNL
jgi:hypothetical protein